MKNQCSLCPRMCNIDREVTTGYCGVKHNCVKCDILNEPCAYFETYVHEKQSWYDIKFNDISLLKEALTHPSYANENFTPHNQRLEYLGDAVIELAMSTYLYDKYRSFDEGDMTKRRAQSVCEEALVIYAEKFNLSEYLLLGHGEELKGGRYRASMIADAFEAIFGIKVASVNVINVRPKAKRLGRYEGKVSGYKKAIVKLAEGQSLDLYSEASE